MEFADTYHRDGYYFPIRVMSEHDAAELRAEFEAVERRATDERSKRLLYKFSTFTVPFLSELARRAEILEPVKAILGNDLLVWGANFFLKEANTPDYVSWHQDLTYWDLSEQAEVTAWLALTPSNRGNGCMRFVPGSHAQAIVDHRDTFIDDNMLSRGQVIDGVDESQAVDVVLQPGEMSLHHGHMFHASQPNPSDERRIGFVVRYIAPSMRQKSGAYPAALLVSGEDAFGNFRLRAPPTRVFDEADMLEAEEEMEIQNSFSYIGAAEQGKRLS